MGKLVAQYQQAHCVTAVDPSLAGHHVLPLALRALEGMTTFSSSR